jgi:hypothetical protein
MTAVEWLVKELGEYLPNSIKDVQSIIEQAKEMEQHQIIDAYIEGYSAPENLGDSQQYYEETYGDK